MTTHPIVSLVDAQARYTTKLNEAGTARRRKQGRRNPLTLLSYAGLVLIVIGRKLNAQPPAKPVPTTR